MASEKVDDETKQEDEEDVYKEFGGGSDIYGFLDKDSELWDVILDGPYVPFKEVKDGSLTTFMAKKIRDFLQTTHEGTKRVKKSKVEMLNTQYENFVMKYGETIFEMNSRFTTITNELRGLGEPIPVCKKVQKILKVLSKSWESRVDVITEAKDLMALPMDERIGNL
ncbi:uncharacterized protein [Solanum lycopersicum]|uniref:uncharacterized protein n=1 Tax=Solanum lycopersicum TaxID=4081 RepID=UPI0002BCAFDD